MLSSEHGFNRGWVKWLAEQCKEDVNVSWKELPTCQGFLGMNGFTGDQEHCAMRDQARRVGALGSFVQGDW
jgi:hypothetical protein